MAWPRRAAHPITWPAFGALRARGTGTAKEAPRLQAAGKRDVPQRSGRPQCRHDEPDIAHVVRRHQRLYAVTFLVRRARLRGGPRRPEPAGTRGMPYHLA